jgi:hypothetical protein
VRAVVDEAQSVAKAAAPFIAGGLAGIAGGIIGGIAGVFVMDPALGAKLGFDLGVELGTGVETVDPKDVDGALQAGAVAVYDAAGNLLAGSPDAPNGVGFVPVPPRSPGVFLRLSINDQAALGIARKVADVGAKVSNAAAYMRILNGQSTAAQEISAAAPAPAGAGLTTPQKLGIAAVLAVTLAALAKKGMLGRALKF